MCEVVLCVMLVLSTGDAGYYPQQFVEDGAKIRYWETYGIPEEDK